MVRLNYADVYGSLVVVVVDVEGSVVVVVVDVEGSVVVDVEGSLVVVVDGIVDGIVVVVDVDGIVLEADNVFAIITFLTGGVLIIFVTCNALILIELLINFIIKNIPTNIIKIIPAMASQNIIDDEYLLLLDALDFAVIFFYILQYFLNEFYIIMIL